MKRALPWMVAGLGLIVGGVAMAAVSSDPPPEGTRWVPPGRPGRFFTWAELTRSTAAARHGLDNTPTPEAAARLRDLVTHVLDPLRERLGRRVHVNSGYRSPAVNRAVGGAATSQHMMGEAADIRVDGMTGPQLARFILDSGIEFDQLVWYDPAYRGHVHVSWTRRWTPRRNVQFAARGADGEAAYTQRLPPRAA